LWIDEEETDRTQEFDGSKLPDYGIVRRYLGLMGNAVVTEDEGWFITGVVLN